MSGGFISGWSYKNGKIAGEIKESESTGGAAETQRLVANPEDCVVEFIDYYERYCYYQSNGELSYCTDWEYIGSTVHTICPTQPDGPGGGGGGELEPETTPIKKLCGNYNFSVVGNSYTGSIRYLMQRWVNRSYPYQSFITNFTESCLTIPLYGITQAQASALFNKAVNDATIQVINELNTHLLDWQAGAVQLRLKNLIQGKLAYAKPGSVWNTNLCAGNIPSTEADWCY